MAEQLVLIDGCEVESVTAIARPPDVPPSERIVRAWWPRGRYWSIKVAVTGQTADEVAEDLIERGWLYVHLIALPHGSEVLRKIMDAEADG